MLLKKRKHQTAKYVLVRGYKVIVHPAHPMGGVRCEGVGDMKTKYKTYLIAVVIILTLFYSKLAGSEAEELGVKIERNVPVPMRDGVILRADVHRPDRGGPYPVLVRRTPYGKDGNFDQFVKAGYIVVSQDVRGRYESKGTWESMHRFQTHDAEDGYDTVEWAAKLTNSTGKVGTFGASYDGFLQWRLATLRPPFLACMSPTIFGLARLVDDVGASGMHPGTLDWYPRMAADMCQRENLPGVHTIWEAKRLWQKDLEKWINWLPWLELPEDFFGYETHTLKQWWKNPHVDPLRLDQGAREIAVPSLQIIGWYDHALGDLLLFRTLVREAKTEVARKGTRIIIGPWPHGGISRRYGDIDFGPTAQLDRIGTQIRWFDYWLKGRQNGIDKDAPVRIFVMGDNRWRDEQHWPLRRTKEKVLYITSDGHANTPSGNGRLVAGKPESGGTDNYLYDPHNPVPTPYGTALPRACDQRPLAKREDILVYQTEPLTERLEVTGNPVVELYASSSAPDTDWFVRLIDVHPDGLARDVCMGMVRARYRHSLAKPELLTPGEVVKYTIRMRPTSHAFIPGHRIRLDITSSDFPWHDRHHNTAANQNADATLVVANQTIYHGGEEATRIILPWIPNPAEEEKPVEEEKPEPDLEKQMYPLHQATADGDIERIKSLISNGADVNEKDKDGQTALNLAVNGGHKAMVELLIAKGADVNGKGRYDAAPLHEAAWAGNKEIAQLLLNKGADANALQGDRWTPLHSACSRGHAEVAELLIQKGAEVDAKDGWDFTPLHYALEEGYTDVVKFLVENGAASNNILHRAIQVRDSKLVEIVLAANTVNLDSKNKALHAAIVSEFTDGAILLIEHGADANAKNSEGMTPLNMAASMGNDTVVEKLRSKGVDLDQRDDLYGFTALHYAARFGNKNVAELLIAHGADIKAKDKWDYQPIHWAAHHDRADVVELLISKGADVNAKTSLGQTPLQLAQERRNTKTIELLRKRGAEE